MSDASQQREDGETGLPPGARDSVAGPTIDAPPSPSGPTVAATAPMGAGGPGRHRMHPGDVGSAIGPYTLVQLLGAGGFGEVYLAQQTEPVRREVALKIIKLGMDTREIIARFEAERQTLARFDHPGVARVLDAGVTDSGRPYFVMDLVRGEPITTYCDRVRMNVRDRLSLFQSVCDAIQHAHNKGIIHRDIKPSNVLVEEIDGNPTPKVIDFGIAKAIDARAADHTAFTASGQMIGTPAYMSPEQTGVEGVDVDTRTDVYSLGVLLYELLTGTTPIEGVRLRTADYTTMQRIILEHDAPRPSTRLSAIGDDATGIAECRGLDAVRLRTLLRGDLDWILMKALDKDRERRYATVNALAADLGRYLRFEPVVARPPSRLYATRKFVRRNRVGVAAGAAVLAATVLGAALATAGFIRARAERDRAVAAEKEARANFDLARGAVDRYLTNVSESAELQDYGLEDLRRRLLGTAAEFYEKLTQQQFATGQTRNELAVAWDRLARIDRTVGKLEEAQAAFQKSQAIFEELIDQSPNPSGELKRQLAAATGTLALTQSELGRGPDAVKSFDRAIAIDESLVAAEPGNDALQSQLASALDSYAQLLERLGRAEDCERMYERSESIRRELTEAFPSRVDYQFYLMQSHINVGALHARAGRLDKAAEALEAAIPIGEKLVAEHPAEQEYRHGLAAGLGNLAGVRMLQGDFDDTESLYKRELKERESLAGIHPNNLEYRLQLGSSYTNLGELEVRRNEPLKALPWLDSAVKEFDWVLEREPQHTIGRYYQSYTLKYRATALDALGRSAEAVPVWERAIKLDDHNDPELRAGLERSKAKAATAQ